MQELTDIEKRVRIDIRDAAFEFATGHQQRRDDLVNSFQTPEEQKAADEYIDILVQKGILEQNGQRLQVGVNFDQL